MNAHNPFLTEFVNVILNAFNGQMEEISSYSYFEKMLKSWVLEVARWHNAIYYDPKKCTLILLQLYKNLLD